MRSVPPLFQLPLPRVYFGVIWFAVVRHLRPEWSLNPQYGYGWSVPFLAAYLLWKRWPDRPVSSPPAGATFCILLLVACALLFAPLRFLGEANPDWRLLSWGLSTLAVTMSILCLFRVGGWSWASYFAFPLVFFLVAVPWPTQLEDVVIQGLMRAVTAINVWFLNLGRRAPPSVTVTSLKWAPDSSVSKRPATECARFKPPS
ncbi:MAG: archaeosortase/exosortase family protein [Spartobacteria bacterium]